MWVRAGYVETMPRLATASPDLYQGGQNAATSGPAETTGPKSSSVGEMRSQRLRLIELGNRARMLRQRSRASLIDSTLAILTREILEHETRSKG